MIALFRTLLLLALWADFSTNVQASRTNIYGYDGNDNLLTVLQGGVTITRTYDPLNRVETYNDGRGHVISYFRDANGNLTSLTYEPGKTVIYAYDARNRLTDIWDWTGRHTVITYDGPSRLLTLTRPNGTVRTNTWDAASQLKTVMDKHVASGKPVLALRLGYDLASRLTDKLEVPAWGNIPALPARSAIYNNDNQIDTFNGQTIGYDLDGNTTSAPAPGTNSPLVSYGWNSRNQLITAPGGMAHSYDAEGQRTSYSINGGAPTTFVNDPHGPLPRVLIRIRPDGTRTFYIYGPVLLYEIEENTGAARYYHYDHLGSTLALTNDAGQVTARANYSAYGERIQTSGNFDTAFGWQGAFGVQTDPNGLHYMRARYYHARLGRFLSEDPLGLAGGSNVYSYANGNPISSNDPLGLCACESRVRTSSVDAYAKPFSWSNAITEVASLVPFARNTLEFITGRSFDDPTRSANRAEAFSRLTFEAAVTVATLPLGGEGAVGSRVAGGTEMKLLGTARDNLLTAAEHPKLSDAINNLYRPGAKIGSGSSMDAFRFEQATGELLSPTGHGQKLLDRRTQLQNLLSNPNLSPSDKQIAKDLLVDIQKALGG